MKAFKSKTINFGLLVALFGSAQANLPALQGIISDAAYGWATFLIGVGIIVLRFVTTKPLEEK